MDKKDYAVEVGQKDDWYAWHNKDYNGEFITYKEALIKTDRTLATSVVS